MTTSKIRTELDQLYNNYSKTFENEQIVLGDGCISGPLIIVGEAPGKDEVSQGKPFVGAAGKNLKEFMDLIGITRESVFITNAIKYRLAKLNEKTNRLINRPAARDDIVNNQHWLHKEITLLRPKIIVTLGNVPLKAVTNDFNASIGEMHGHVHTCNIGEKAYLLFPLYHPASIIYNRSLKDIYNNDVLILKEVLTSLDTSNKLI